MSAIHLNIYDGTRQPISPKVQLLVRIIDGNQKEVLSRFLRGSSITITDLPFYNGLGDLYTVIVHGDGFTQSGLHPIYIQENATVDANLMLLPENGVFRFPPLDDIRQDHPRIYRLLANNLSPADLKNKFNDAIEGDPDRVGALLTISAAAATIPLPGRGKNSPLDYDWQLRWDLPAKDRFYAYVDRRLVAAVRQAADLHIFSEEKNASSYHPGIPGKIHPATVSWKEVRFEVANVQLTFHEQDSQPISFSGPGSKKSNIPCVIVEPDIDYYRDLLAHGLLEFLPHLITGGKTDPRVAYMLRWMAQRFENLPDFDPPFTVVAS